MEWSDRPSGELHSIIGPNGAGRRHSSTCSSASWRATVGRSSSRRADHGLSPDQIVGRGSPDLSKSSASSRNSRFWRTSVSPSRRGVRTASICCPGGGAGRPGRRGPAIIGSWACRQGGGDCQQPVPRRPATPGVGIALATAPEVLLLTSHWRAFPRERVRVTDLIQRLAERVTIVLIEHDIDRVLASRIGSRSCTRGR